ncbi:MAG: hypothetical protein AAFV88_07815 [Planctomycetota bacterium]
MPNPLDLRRNLPPAVALCLFTAVALIGNSAQAAITIEIADTTVREGTLSAAIDVLIRSDVAGGDIPGAIATDFTIANAEFLDPAGEFDQAGFFNQGNYAPPPASGIERDANDFGLAFASFEMETFTAVPTDNAILARLFVNTAPLATGTYQLNAENPFIFSDIGQVIDSSAEFGTLTVVAIPEAGSSALIAALGGFVVCRRRKRAATSM